MEKQRLQFSIKEIQKNHDVYLARAALYKKFGLDQEKERKKIIENLHNHRGTILEIGTGMGYLTTMLARIFTRVVSVDMDGHGQKIASLNAAYDGLLKKIKFVTADAGMLDFPDMSFDFVVSAFTFHHLNLPFVVIKEMKRLACKQIVISDFNSKGFEVINNIHRYEGRNHEITTEYFDVVGMHLGESGFNVNVLHDEYQTIYSAIRK